jgi:Fur family ferric uptake transcriptional regulator
MGIVRKTKAISLLLEMLNNTDEALSVVELVDRLKATINKSTVYRALERMEQDGIVHSIVSKDGLKWYAKCTGCSTECHNDNHAHFQCLQCGKMFCLPIKMEKPVVKNYKIESSEFFLQGKCKVCLTKH